jgi:pimeloyl-ACP methyl ester carboxylesterase
MLEEFRLQFEKGIINGRANGAIAAPLVMGIHGWSNRNGWHTWISLLEPLGRAGFFAVSLDMPGWGQSSAWGDEQLTVGEATQCLIMIADNLRKDRFVLMGKSWGGGVAIQTALDHADRVAGLILTAPAYLQFDRLGDIRQPVLLAWAKDDPVIPVRYATKFQASIPDAEVVLYETGGHNAAQANSTNFAPRAIRFLQLLTGWSEADHADQHSP